MGRKLYCLPGDSLFDSLIYKNEGIISVYFVAIWDSDSNDCNFSHVPLVVTHDLKQVLCGSE